jgi:hypothetical protein
MLEEVLRYKYRICNWLGFVIKNIHLCFVQDIYHERAWLYSSVDQVNIKCVVETTGDEHCERLYQHLAAKGYVFTKHA